MADIKTLKGGDAITVNVHNENYAALNNDIIKLTNDIQTISDNIGEQSVTLTSTINTKINEVEEKLNPKIENIKGVSTIKTQTLTSEKETTLRQISQDTSGTLTKINNVIYRPNKESNQYSYGSNCTLNTSAFNDPLEVSNDSYSYVYKEYSNIKYKTDDTTQNEVVAIDTLSKEIEILIPSEMKGKYSASYYTYSYLKVALPDEIDLSGDKYYFEGSIVFEPTALSVPTNVTAFAFESISNNVIPIKLTSKLTADTDFYIKINVKAIKQEIKND